MLPDSLTSVTIPGRFMEGTPAIPEDSPRRNVWRSGAHYFDHHLILLHSQRPLLADVILSLYNSMRYVVNYR